MSSESEVLESWSKMKELMSALDLDIYKNIGKKNVTAGSRLRKALRTIKKQAVFIIKQSIESDKLVKAGRRDAKS